MLIEEEDRIMNLSARRKFRILESTGSFLEKWISHKQYILLNRHWHFILSFCHRSYESMSFLKTLYNLNEFVKHIIRFATIQWKHIMIQSLRKHHYFDGLSQESANNIIRLIFLFSKCIDTRKIWPKKR